MKNSDVKPRELARSCPATTGKKTIVVLGHYGVGKTTVAMRILRNFAPRATIADLDVVNPFFRSSDYAREISELGCRLIAPEFAGTNLETSTLSGEIDGALALDENTLILDVGGDPEGAAVLGRYAPALERRGYICVYVVNKFRPETRTAEAAAGVLRELERSSGLHATHVFDNTNLMGEGFTPDEKYIEKITEITNLPIYEAE